MVVLRSRIEGWRSREAIISPCSGFPTAEVVLLDHPHQFFRIDAKIELQRFERVISFIFPEVDKTRLDRFTTVDGDRHVILNKTFDQLAFCCAAVFRN